MQISTTFSCNVDIELNENKHRLARSYLSVKGQGQICQLFRLTEPTMIHYPAKLHQNLTSNFRVMSNFY